MDASRTRRAGATTAGGGAALGTGGPAAVPGGQPAIGAYREVPVPMLPQEPRVNWCWASAAAAVAGGYEGTPPTHCRVANRTLGQTGCCEQPVPCDVPHELQIALAAVGHLRPNQGFQAGVVAERDVPVQIDAGRPIGCRIQWPDGSGHFILLTGYQRQADGSLRVVVRDPQGAGRYSLPWIDLCRAYRQVGVWTHTYFTR